MEFDPKINMVQRDALAATIRKSEAPTKSKQDAQTTVQVQSENQPSYDRFTEATEGDKRGSSERELPEKMVADAVAQANDFLKATHRNLQFAVHDKTNKIMVKVIDRETDEVIREIPPEKMLDVVAKMWELAGIFVDEKG